MAQATGTKEPPGINISLYLIREQGESLKAMQKKTEAANVSAVIREACKRYADELGIDWPQRVRVI